MDSVWNGYIILTVRSEALGSPGTAILVPVTGGVGKAGGRDRGVDNIKGEGSGNIYNNINREGGGSREEVEDGDRDIIIDNTGYELSCVYYIEAVKVISILS